MAATLAPLTGCGGGNSGGTGSAGGGSAPPEVFYTGADVSLLARMEALGQSYRAGGQIEGLLETFRNHGCNMMRLRLWVDPTGTDIYVNDLAYTVTLALRIRAAGHGLLLDIHYADTWADPGHQPTPAAWSSLELIQLIAQVRSYTAQVIATLRDAGAMPDIVQIGNEMTDGMLWPIGRISVNGWSNFSTLLKAGIQGVKDSTGGATAPKIMVHIDRSGDWSTTQWFFDNLVTLGVAYDLIGLSFYPVFHGPLSGAKMVLADVAARYGKSVMVVETGYPFEGTWSGAWATYPISPAGQRQFLIDLVASVRMLPGGLGLGVLFWEPEWLHLDALQSDWAQKTLYDDGGDVLPGLAALGGLLDPSLHYQIVNRLSGMALAIAAASTNSGAAAVQSVPAASTDEQWALAGNSAGWFSLTAHHSGLALDNGGSASAGTAIVQATDSGTLAQQWDLVDAGGGYFRIVNRQSGLVLDAAGSLLEGAVLVQSVEVATPQQHWTLVPAA
jgi:arabinogalactan endo-1,4-beta-galactosidase